MFTGIVEEMGILKAIEKGTHSAVLQIQASDVLEDVKKGGQHCSQWRMPDSYGL